MPKKTMVILRVGCRPLPRCGQARRLLYTDRELDVGIGKPGTGRAIEKKLIESFHPNGDE
jgi:hypothetical protein